MWAFVYPGGPVDPGTVGGQHWLCGGALQKVPHFAWGAAEFPEDWAEPGHTERGKEHGMLSLQRLCWENGERDTKVCGINMLWQCWLDFLSLSILFM